MKKNTELKIRIVMNWVKISIAWAIATVIAFLILNTINYKSDSQAIGFLMLSPLFGLLVISPLACRWDSFIRKYTKILNSRKEKGFN